jgi:hypothetical protein
MTMTPFLTNGILTRKHGFLIPVTSEDPSLLVIETKPNSKNWAILFFLGEPKNILLRDCRDVYLK